MCRPSERRSSVFWIFGRGGGYFSRSTYLYIKKNPHLWSFIWLQSHWLVYCDSSFPRPSQGASVLPSKELMFYFVPAVETAWLEYDNHLNKNKILRQKSLSCRRILVSASGNWRQALTQSWLNAIFPSRCLKWNHVSKVAYDLRNNHTPTNAHETRPNQPPTGSEKHAFPKSIL